VDGGGGLYSGPVSVGVRSDRLVSFGAAGLGPIGSFRPMLSVHLYSTYVLYIYIYIYCLLYVLVAMVQYDYNGKKA
jgi:hypothetical protein